MSFFYNPLCPQFSNQCYFVPVLPYFIDFSQTFSFNRNSETCLFPVKKQETRENDIRTIDYTMELQKFKNFDYQQQKPKIQEQILLEIKKSNPETQLAVLSKKAQRRTGKKSTINDKNPVSENSNEKSICKLSKPMKFKKNKLNQEEYQPFQKRKKCQINIKENENRNIIPNQVNQIFSYIQKSSKSKLVVARIFNKYPPTNPDYTIKKFYVYQSLLKEKVSNYINQTSLSLVKQLYDPSCSVYSEQEQLYYNKICRILIHHFLQQDSIFNILTSRRMHNDKKKKHLQMRRELKWKVVEILKH